MKTKLKEMLDAYRNGTRGPIEYHELANLLVGECDGRVYLDAVDAAADAVIRDALYPVYVVFTPPQVVADEQAILDASGRGGIVVTVETAPCFYPTVAHAFNCDFRAEGATFMCNGGENPVTYVLGGMRVDLSGWTCTAPGATAPQVVADERQAFEAWIIAAFDECGEDEPNLILDENGRYNNDMRVLTSWQVWQARAALAAAPVQAPVDMLLYCPACGAQHIDAAEDEQWGNPPHRSHLCHGCKHVWRPADVPTNGVASIKTAGSKDSAPVQAQEPAAYADPKAFVNFKAGACINEWMWAKPDAGLEPLFRAPVQPVAVPDGWKLMPIEATRAMIDAASAVEEDGYDAMHKAMAAAAPAPAAQGDTIESQLNEEERAFLRMVILFPGAKLGSLEANGQWHRPENLGLVTCVGSWKWRPTDKLLGILLDSQPVAVPDAKDTIRLQWMIDNMAFMCQQGEGWSVQNAYGSDLGWSNEGARQAIDAATATKAAS